MKTTVLLLLPLSLLFSCSKEKQTEKQLFSDSGEWNVVSTIWQEFYQVDTVLTNTSGTSVNMGVFKFDKDNSGSQNFIVNSLEIPLSHLWFVENETVYIHGSYVDSSTPPYVTITSHFQGELQPDDSIFTVKGTTTVEKYEEIRVYLITMVLEKQ